MNVDKQLITVLLETLHSDQTEQVRDIVLSMYLENKEGEANDDCEH
ncbi:hypothetical protein [Anaerobacillus alkalidiazotrophicus]|nr:hypothetical protein [Anaerobacillus alkalidiazotrophicus]